jgi:phosphatidylglycerophosphate synthase
MNLVPKLWIDTGALQRAESLFGIAPLERLRRSLRTIVTDRDSVTISGPAAGAVSWPGAQVDTNAAPLGSRLRGALAKGPLVVLDGALVIDPRLIQFLRKVPQPCVAARGEGPERAVALHLDPSLVDAIPANATDLVGVADALLAAGLIAPVDECAFPTFIHKLRRSLPYWLYRVEDAATRRRLERQMFWDNYKGSTDLLTAYVYPPLVWQAVRVCTHWHIHPNVLTVMSIILAFAAVPLFAGAHWLAGFACAYAMSVLDSVDGKVARLTLTDSRIGNVLDHGLDQVHPPFWYFAWAWGLGARDLQDPLYQAAIWLIVFYIADRLVLGVAKRRLGHTLHASTRLDERVRSIIARRNITMTIMAAALLAGVGPIGFFFVTLWQGLTFVWHSWRTLWLGFLGPDRRRSEA